MNGRGPLKQARISASEAQIFAPFSAEEQGEFGQAIASHFGHFQDLSREKDLAAILRMRMRLTGCNDYASYRELLNTAAEWEALAPLLTVAETYFFRMPSHFEALAQDVLPQVLDANRGRRTLRILSAGCASGEEPYTLRILLNERFPELNHWSVTIVGVDLSLTALERARAGVYTEWSLRATSAERREANFTAEGKRFRIRQQVRAGVTFRRENLLASPPEESAFDIIFCRNVLIYFTDEAIHTAIARLTERLRPSGFLFLGPAESLRGISDRFELRQGHDVFYYRLRSSEERVAPGKMAPRSLSPRSVQARSNKGEGVPLQSAASSPEPFDEGTWFASIQQSWQRLAALVPGPQTPAAKAVSVPQLTSSPRGDEAFFALVAAERFAQALDLLETMTSDAGSQADGNGTRLLRASMLTNLSRYGEAERECKLLLAADPTNAGAHFLLGLCREQAGALGEAEEHMARTTYLDPTFPMAHVHRGLIARRQRDLPGAKAAFRLAIGAIEEEDANRLALFGGGFSRESLKKLCMRELDALARDVSDNSGRKTRDQGARG